MHEKTTCRLRRLPWHALFWVHTIHVQGHRLLRSGVLPSKWGELRNRLGTPGMHVT